MVKFSSLSISGSLGGLYADISVHKSRSKAVQPQGYVSMFMQPASRINTSPKQWYVWFQTIYADSMITLEASRPLTVLHEKVHVQ